MKPQVKVQPQTALITGGSSGIGLAFAEALAEKGYNLVIVSNQDAIYTVAKDLTQRFKVTVTPIFLNLATDNAAHTLHEYCKKHRVTIDILINNAGILLFDEIDDITDAEAIRILKLHVQTPTMLCKLFGTDMKDRGTGHILIVSSITAWSTYPKLMLYAATKRYLRDFGKALHYEMKDYGVNVTTICPGAVNTDLFPLDQKYRQRALRLGIMMEPDKVAKKSLKRLFKKRASYVPGVSSKIMLFFLKIISMNTVQWVRHKFPIFSRRRILQRARARQREQAQKQHNT